MPRQSFKLLDDVKAGEFQPTREDQEAAMADPEFLDLARRFIARTEQLGATISAQNIDKRDIIIRALSATMFAALEYVDGCKVAHILDSLTCTAANSLGAVSDRERPAAYFLFLETLGRGVEVVERYEAGDFTARPTGRAS